MSDQPEALRLAAELDAGASPRRHQGGGGEHMSKHTPGPWKATCRDMTYKGGDWSEDEFLQWEVEGPRAPFGRGDFFQADARLIAAAPDLLEALKQIEPILARMYGQQAAELPPMQIVRAAIAKAEEKT